MGYTDVFGGNLIFPSRVSYLELTTAIDVTLQWPTEQQITGGDVVADVMDVNTTAPALNIDMPDARNTSLGNKATFNNVGGNTFTVRDSTGGTIQDVQAGEQWVVVLTDNSTDMGLWTTFLLGGNAATPASASVLAGDGLEADGSQLNQIIDSDVEAGTPFTVVSGDRAKCLIYTAGAGTCNLPNAGAVDIGNNWFFMLRNSGSGTLNIVPPAGDIDGASSLNLDPNGSTFIFTDGVDWYTIGLTVASTIAFDFISLAVPGSGDFVLSGANLDRISYRFTGALTGNRRIVVPNTTQQYWADNQTSGAFTLEVSTAAGAGIQIPQGQSVIVYSDATDVINATSSTSVAFPITIGQGGTSATTAAGARTNLNAAFDGILINTPGTGGLAGGGDLTADRTLVIELATVPTAVPDLAADFFLFQDVDDADLTKKALLDTIGITVEDEGVPLATVAIVLDFVGGFVTASGAGSTKTITIGAPLVLLDGEEIQFGTGNDIQLAFDGGVALEMLSTLAGGQAFVINSSGTAATLEIDMLNSAAGCRLDIEGVSGTINFQYITTPGGVRTNRLWVGNLADGQLLLLFGDSFVANTAVSSGSYPHFDDGGFEVNNSSTGNGQSRALTWYDQHFAVGNTNLSRNLVGSTPVEDPDLVSDDGGAPTLRQGFYKLEMWMVLQGQDTTTDFIFDFQGTNLGFLSYSWEAESADGTPFSRGASGLVAADQTVDLGATVGEEVFLRIRGQFFINSNGGDINFRWAPSANVIDDVTRQQGAYMGIAATRIG